MSPPLVTPPTYPQNSVFVGDVDILNALSSDMGDGSLYIRNGGLYVSALTELNQTTIVTNSGLFTVEGSNAINFNVTAPINQTAVGNSNFTTTTGSLQLTATDTTAGNVLIQGSGLGPDSVKIYSSNSTSGQIDITSAGGSTTVTPILINATDATNGYINITAAGNYASNNSAISLNATNTTSGVISLLSAGNTSGVNAISLKATGTTAGNVLISGSGNYTGNIPAIYLKTTDTTGGKILLESTGTALDSIWAVADNGGIKITAQKEILINTADTVIGVVIAPTSLVPVTIGSSGSITSILGNLEVFGTNTILNTVTLTVENNVIILDSGSEVSGIDAGLAVRRFQTPNNTPSGDVIITPTPIQESGLFQTGSAVPGTLVLAVYSSVTNDFYKGWWIKITSGAAINQVRRVKSYNASTNTITVYATGDNVAQTPGPLFTDGLDLVTAPASGDSYRLYSASYIASYYDETNSAYSFYTSSDPDVSGITSTTIQQPQAIDCGELSIVPYTYNNAKVSATGTVITVTLQGHNVFLGYIIAVSNSRDITPTLTTGKYTIASIVDANNFTITASASSTTVADSSITMSILNSSILRTNVIEPYTPGFAINIPGLSLSETIIIPKTSTSLYSLFLTQTYGAYIIFVADSINTNGAFAIFSVANSGVGGSVSRINSSKGIDGQRLMMTYTVGNSVQIYQNPAASSGTGNYTYICRIFSAM
jgi:hypothetical protein